MMLRLVFKALLLTAASCASGKGLPPSVVGEWDETVAGCGDPESLNGVRITPYRIQFYEAGGDVRSVKSLSIGEVEVSADWADVNVEGADGLPAESAMTIRLAPSVDGSSLRMEMHGVAWTVVRCEASAILG